MARKSESIEVDLEAVDARGASAVDAEVTDIDGEPLPWLFRSQRNIAWVLLIGGIIGLAASFSLTLEYLHKLQEPDAQLICDINPFVTCGPAMASSAGNLLGFPNIIIGLVSFSVVIATAMAIFAGARMRAWYWIGMQIGLIGAAALITYLQYFSVFELARLCLWCMIIWAGTIPLVALTTVYNLAAGHLGAGVRKFGRALTHYAWTIVVLWYVLVIGVIFMGMWDVISLSF